MSQIRKLPRFINKISKDVKSKDVKSKDVKSKDVKSKDVKSKDEIIFELDELDSENMDFIDENRISLLKRLEKEKLEKEMLEKEMLEKEKLEKEMLEREKLEKEMFEKAEHNLRELLKRNEENKQKKKRERENKERDERDKKEEEMRINYEKNIKRVHRHQEMIQKYGDSHEMTSLCEQPTRPLTPVREIDSPPPSFSMDDLDYSYDQEYINYLKENQNKIDILDMSLTTIIESSCENDPDEDIEDNDVTIDTNINCNSQLTQSNSIEYNTIDLLDEME